MGTSIMAN